MCYHTTIPTILSHVFYMAIYIVERTASLMEFMLFRYHKIKKGNIHLPDNSNKQCYLTFFSRVILSCVCVSWDVFCAIKRNCIVLHCIVFGLCLGEVATLVVLQQLKQCICLEVYVVLYHFCSRQLEVEVI